MSGEEKLTTVAIWESTKDALDSRKKIPSESYDNVIRRLLGMKDKNGA